MPIKTYAFGIVDMFHGPVFCIGADDGMGAKVLVYVDRLTHAEAVILHHYCHSEPAERLKEITRAELLRLLVVC